jgi:hypothetical protein
MTGTTCPGQPGRPVPGQKDRTPPPFRGCPCPCPTARPLARQADLCATKLIDGWGRFVHPLTRQQARSMDSLNKNAQHGLMCNAVCNALPPIHTLWIIGGWA